MVDQDQLVEIVRTVKQLALEVRSERLAFNLTEASELTGIDVQQLRFAIARRELRAKKVGKSYRITRTALLGWLDTP